MILASIIAGVLIFLLIFIVILRRQLRNLFLLIPFDPYMFMVFSARPEEPREPIRINAYAFVSLTIILLGFLGGGYIILSGNPDPNAQKIASGIIGTAFGWAIAQVSRRDK